MRNIEIKLGQTLNESEGSRIKKEEKFELCKVYCDCLLTAI